jgi:hypothetical protein
MPGRVKKWNVRKCTNCVVLIPMFAQANGIAEFDCVLCRSRNNAQEKLQSCRETRAVTERATAVSDSVSVMSARILLVETWFLRIQL